MSTHRELSNTRANLVPGNAPTRIALVLCLAVGAGLAQTPAAVPQKKPGSVEGTIRNSATGQAIRKATITLRNGMASYVAVSDPEGRFRMAGVEPSNYTLTAQCPGFASEHADQGISVAEEQAVTGITIKLVPYGIISGKIVGANGEPIAGIEVTSIRIDYSDGRRRFSRIQEAQTDDRGEYRLFDIPAGNYYVFAASSYYNRSFRNHSDQPEQTYPAAFFPGVNGLAGASAIKLAPGSDVAGVDFHLPRVSVYHIRGKAMDAETREAVHGPSLDLTSCDSGLTPLADTILLLPNGTFDISEPPGVYCLTLAQSISNGGYIGAMGQVVVSNKDVSEVVLDVWHAVDVPGTIVYEGPAPDRSRQTNFTFIPVADAHRPNVEVKPDNSFVMHQAAPVMHELQSASLPEGYYVKAISYGGKDVSGGQFKVTPGSPLTLTLASDSGQLSVTVQDAAGRPAMGAWVLAAPQDGRRYCFGGSLSQTGGIAVISGLAPGDYKVFALEKSSDGIANVPEFRKLVENRAVSVTVAPNGKTSVQTQLIPVDVIEDARSKMQ